MSIALIDTSVFCELLGIPGKAQDHQHFTVEFQNKVAAEEIFLLPLATVIETGNFIGQLPDGGQRRFFAKHFTKIVLDAINGESPFTATGFFERPELKAWLSEFPEWVKPADRGLGDLTIMEEWRRQCALHEARRVYIWSKDGHLSGYDRAPRI